MAALRSFPPGGSLSANAAQIVQKSSNLFIKPKQTEPLPTTEFSSTTVFLYTSEKIHVQLKLQNIFFQVYGYTFKNLT